MKQISSSEFQRTYQRLTEPHEVTALGRVIATYYPTGTEPGAAANRALRDIGRRDIGGFGSARPAPKPGKSK
jgi:hypothetical protein